MIHTIKTKVQKITKPAADSLRQSIEAAPPAVQKRVKQFLIGLIVLLVVIVAYKFVRLKLEERERAAEIAAGPQVRVAQAIQSPGTHAITQIGETRPYSEATLYAKVSGYLKIVKVDKGDFVKAGQVLAVIESPETDQGYEAALAENRNKQAIASRMDVLFKKRLVSQQETDQSRADADVASARLRTQETLKSYETIRAPFSGTITARFADPGALLQNAMTSQTSALPVLTVSTIDRLRVDVFVDQHDAPYVAKDQAIEITLTDRPGFKINGHVSRISGALDPRTKMLLTEIDIPNTKNELVAGSFVQVSLQIKSPPYVEVPVEALVMKNNKPFVTAVTDKNEITFKPIETINNDGKMLWVSSGINVGEWVALNIADTVAEGGKIRPIKPEPAKAEAPKPAEKKP